MLIYYITFFVVFLIIFIISFICIKNLSNLKENIFLFIPSICIGLWALYLLYDYNFEPLKGDFQAFYSSGKRVFTDPEHLYDVEGFLYFPSFAILFGITFSLLPFDLAYYMLFIVNYVLAICTIIQYNKILILMNVKEKVHRLIFLIIVSNGFIIYNQFYWNQTKFFTLLLLLIVIKRELRFKKENIEKNLKFYFLNYNLLIFAIGMAPYFIFLLLIYLFYNISHHEYIKKENVKKYIILLITFIIQNFLFLLFPSLIFDFLDGLNHPSRRRRKLKLIYLREWIFITSSTLIRTLTIIFTIVLSIITIMLIFQNKMTIEEKFGYFCIAYLFFGMFAYSVIISLILFNFILLLFVPYLNKDKNKISDFIQNNKILLAGIISISAMFFSVRDAFPNPFYKEFPYNIFYYSRWIVFLSIMMLSLIKLKLKESRS